MDKLTDHFNKYFEQDDPLILHQDTDIFPHIDILLYTPNEKYPFWKLVTMGASDYVMPKDKRAIANRNEYMMFVDPQLNLYDKEIVDFYYSSLLDIAYYPVQEGISLTYGHSLEWPESENTDMLGAYIEMPQIIENIGVLRCKLGLFKKVACLQVVLLTKEEIDKLLEVGNYEFSDYLYPEDASKKEHFLSEQYRTNKF